MPSPTAKAPKAPRSKRAAAVKPAPVSPNTAGKAAITNYTTALRWLYEHVDFERMRMVKYNERTFSLARMRKLLDLMGNPHQSLKCVQVAGTKGKGSTCAMLSAMLRRCGYTVGLYTSPHLVDLRERISIDGQMIAYHETADIFKQIAAKEKAFANAPLTFFEIITAAALKYFADQAVDIAVLETGLGGRLDCTNVVNPLVTAITHISLDHTHILGGTLPLIAREKAGIFKKDVPALTVQQDPEVLAVLKEVAEQVGAPISICGDGIDFSYRFEANRELGPHTRVCLTTPTSRFEHLPVPLRGEHQAHNCGLALAILDKLKAHGFQAPEDQVISGLALTQLPGRMEQVWAEPRIIIDGAHNAHSIQALIKALGAHISYDSLVMIFGCGQDKDVTGMLRQIALGADKIIFTRAKSNPRACEAEDLLRKFSESSGKMAQTAPSLPEALKLAARAVSREDLIVVAGSFYLAGEAKKYFLDLANKPRPRR
ncbi:MAG: bifunctional folylpolyglutamate synthase/dihydrofolate synthase [Phycisphaeraceae bacterium]|nr:bifunctional folylpolyglutamate synthase/dihydrofolate synthase [Phycisphaeraceae bacterium]